MLNISVKCSKISLKVRNVLNHSKGDNYDLVPWCDQGSGEHDSGSTTGGSEEASSDSELGIVLPGRQKNPLRVRGGVPGGVAEEGDV